MEVVQAAMSQHIAGHGLIIYSIAKHSTRPMHLMGEHIQLLTVSECASVGSLDMAQPHKRVHLVQLGRRKHNCAPKPERGWIGAEAIALGAAFHRQGDASLIGPLGHGRYAALMKAY
ncbi:uncharacterized protein An07g01760 [Aspergillus niger]|uniref:Contig An07c0020, genomic contig n=2 Tax=Aspergillus niger TaxID=5061 RepID=A2QME0_ASPNC|nr:uncharacterized protein An07g01760 [Aspergillus niger]CAK96621.1 unnamed protein product [Aspergillus niger]